MNSFDEFEPSFNRYDEFPEEDPFVEPDGDWWELDTLDPPRDGDPADWEGFQVESELEFKDGVTERLLEVIEEYLQFSTKAELLTLVNMNF